MRAAKEFWVGAILLAGVVIMEEGRNVDGGDDASAIIFPKLIKLINSISHDLNLGEVWTAKPVLDGKSIKAILGRKGGPIVGKYMQKQMEWSLRYPAGTAEQLKAWIVQEMEKEELSSVK